MRGRERAAKRRGTGKGLGHLMGTIFLESLANDTELRYWQLQRSAVNTNRHPTLLTRFEFQSGAYNNTTPFDKRLAPLFIL